MRLVFLGTADIARPVLRGLSKAGHEILAVVTQPDRPRGRSKELLPPPVKEEAHAIGLNCPVLQPERLGRRTRERIAALAPEVGIVVAYGQILSREILSVPPHGFLNVHASILPRWRGAAPVQRAIEAGDAESGVTIMRVVPRLDAGPVFAVRRTAIGPSDTSEMVLSRLGDLGADGLLETLGALGRGEAVATPQDEAQVTYARPIRKEEGAIDWSLGAGAIDRRIRAFTPWPGGYAFVHRTSGAPQKGGPQRVEVLAVDAAPDGLMAARAAPAPEPSAGGVGEGFPLFGQEPAEPGRVLAAEGERLVVACGDGGCSIRRVKPAGKREMAVAEWLRGRPIAIGDTLRPTG